MNREDTKSLVREILKTIGEDRRKRRKPITFTQGGEVFKVKTPPGRPVKQSKYPYDLPPIDAPKPPEKQVEPDVTYTPPETRIDLGRRKRLPSRGTSGDPYGPPPSVPPTTTPSTGATPPEGSSIVPQDVQTKVAQGGKVVFGKYFDSTETYLGRVAQGKWIPADQDQNEVSTLQEYQTDNQSGEPTMKREKVKSLMREILKTITERSKENKAKKDALSRQAGQDFYINRSLSQKQAAADLRAAADDSLAKHGIDQSAHAKKYGQVDWRAQADDHEKDAQQSTRAAVDPAASIRAGRVQQQGQGTDPLAVRAFHKGNAAQRAQAGLPPIQNKDVQAASDKRSAMQNINKMQGPAGYAGGRFQGGPVPPKVALAASRRSGGKVVFGKYFDSTGKYLGRVAQGKWVDAAQDQDQPSALKESKSLSLRSMLMENAYNRVNLMKIGALMEKALPELTKDQSKKLTEMFTELSVMSTNMNSLSYTVKEYKLNEWQLLIASFHKKLNEFRSEVMNINEKSDKVNCVPLIKALDEVLTY